MSNFSKLGLSKPVIDVLGDLGFEQPTEIQEKAIPELLNNNPTDFIGLAQTGTGKTAAFGLPLIDLIDSTYNGVQALIMAPTRELGQQIAQQLQAFSKNQKQIRVEVVYGGVAIQNQIKALKKPVQIVVATPGRLLDLIKRKAIKLDMIDYVVLDEADEMLNMGFKEDIDSILGHTPDDRVTWLFSATMPKEIRNITKKYMDHPIEVSVNLKQLSNVDISHQYVITKSANKMPALKRFLDLDPTMRGVMFCRTKRETQEIADQLSGLGYGAEALHGDLSQAQRDAVMKKFKNKSMQLLIATDVAARGIDVDDLTHVIHHRLPDSLDSYTHRSGRTGRAGKKGISLAFINPNEGSRIGEIEKKVNITFERIDVPDVKELKSSRIDKWVKEILSVETNAAAEDIYTQVEEQFKYIKKEELLKKLITNHFSKLSNLDGESGNINETNERGGRDSPKKVRAGYHRYFINLGRIDGVSKGDLVHFISEVSEIPMNQIGAIELQKNYSFFEVDSLSAVGLTDKFQGIEAEGRAIRINRDDVQKDSKKHSKHRQGKRPTNKFGGRGRRRRR